MKTKKLTLISLVVLVNMIFSFANVVQANTGQDLIDSLVAQYKTNDNADSNVVVDSKGSNATLHGDLTNYTSATSTLVNVAPYPSLAVYRDYPNYTSNQFAWSMSYLPAATWAHFIMHGHTSRIRQSGTIKKVKFYFRSTTYLTNFQISVWRQTTEGANDYELIGLSNNLVTSITANANNDITLGTPITGVKEGDFYGIVLGYSQAPGTASFMYAYGGGRPTGITPGKYAYTVYGMSNETGSTRTEPQVGDHIVWRTLTNGVHIYGVSTDTPIVELFMDAPVIVSMGNSITSGFILPTGGHYSYMDTYGLNSTSGLQTTYPDGSTKNDLARTWPYKLSQLLGVAVQNAGYTGETTAQINSRFVTYATNIIPRFVILEAGHNDITAVSDEATAITQRNLIISGYTSMLQAAVAAGIKPIIFLMAPRNETVTGYPTLGGTTLRMQTVDWVNTQLRALAVTYNAFVVDTMAVVGQFRSGGDAGNLWDIQYVYSADGLHFTDSGNAALALAIYHLINSKDTSYYSTSGVVNNALSFDGSNTYINTDNTFQSTFQNSFSVNLWVKPTDGQRLQQIISAQNTTGTNKYSISALADGSIGVNYMTNSQEVTATSSSVFSDGQETWHMVTAVVQQAGATVTINSYLDGSLIKTASGSGTMSNFSNDSTVLLGALYTGLSQFYYGLLDNVMIYNKALDQNEVTYLYYSSNGTELDTLDTTAPTSVTTSSITADSPSSLTVTATSTDTESGLPATPYWFEETSGNTGGSSSNDWQASNVFRDDGLRCGLQYTYRVKARDAAGNISDYSSSVSLSVGGCGGSGGFTPISTSTPTASPPNTLKPISLMTVEEIKAKIMEIQEQIIELLNQLIKILQVQVVQLLLTPAL